MENEDDYEEQIDENYMDEEIYDDYSNPENIDLTSSKPTSQKYEFLMSDQLNSIRKKAINEFVEYSSLTEEEAELILINYNWNIEILMNEYFDKKKEIEINCGIKQSKEGIKLVYEYFKKNGVNEGLCPICSCDIEKDEEIILNCEHKFCIDCFYNYLKEKINDQLTLLHTPCPLKGCNYVVTSNIFKKCFKNDKKAMQIYIKCLLRNFAESNCDIKKCPNPKCDLYILLPGHGMVEIKCHCGCVFCFKCLKESHRPCDCFMVEKWKTKVKSDDQDVQWIKLNTKQCPNCHKYIEKNQGCNHMTCRKSAGGCGYEFCWICLGDWKKHTDFYNCQKVAKEKMQLDDSERQKVKIDLEKFIYYSDNYKNQVNAQNYAMELNDKIEEKKSKLIEEKSISTENLKFLDEAVNTVIDCHRILKNTYIFGYFIKNNSNKKSMFEFNQSLLNGQSDLLHELLELDSLPKIIKIYNFEEFNKEFTEYKGRVNSLIGSISKYRNNVLNEVENDLNIIDYDLLKKI